MKTAGVLLLVCLLNSCASVPRSDYNDPSQYNANTQCPAVGGPSLGRF